MPSRLAAQSGFAQDRAGLSVPVPGGLRQPTVSQHIRRLEEQVGRTLVLRDTHSVALTADGEERGQLVKRERLVWVGTPSTRLDLTRPLPLVVYPAPSLSRTEIRRPSSPPSAPDTGCLSSGSIDLVLLTNPRTDQRPAVRALIATVLASGSRSLTAGGA
jgi:Bacterial regulatory helix-turn-helix protein, lysR family